MGALPAEFIKLRRSLAWVVVVVLPLALVLSAVVNTAVVGREPGDAWDTLWMRSLVFYGLFPLPVGIAILASLVWRVEHRGGNWNALMSGPTSTARVVTAKAGVTFVLAAAMQLVMFVAVVVVGKLVLGLPDLLPARYVGVSLLIALACLPAAVLQSALSMTMRSFAAPVAVALVGAGVSVVALVAGLPGAIASPYALLARATQTGTGTFADPGPITPGPVLAMALTAVVVGGALLAATSHVLDRRDVRT